MKVSIPQSVWWMTTNSLVPRSFEEMMSERMASSQARPPRSDDVGITDVQPQEPLGVEPRIHTR